MRPFLALVTGFVLLQAPIAKAGDDFEFDAADEASEVEATDMADYSFAADRADGVAARAVRWNRWTCTAHGGPLQIRIFRGQSFYFRDGSGEGQEAKRVAQKIAVRNCEFAGINNCTSDLNRCTVESH